MTVGKRVPSGIARLRMGCVRSGHFHLKSSSLVQSTVRLGQSGTLASLVTDEGVKLTAGEMDVGC